MKYNDTYNRLRYSYTAKDGLRALGLYVVYMLLVFLQGYLYLTDISVKILDFAQAGFAIVEVLIGIVFIRMSKGKLYSIGINKDNIGKSLTYGIIGAFILRIFIIIFDGIIKGMYPIIQPVPVKIIITFIICAISEEIIFRGFIQTRLEGLIKNTLLASSMNAFLFLSIHYPVRWVITGSLDFSVLTGFYIICLILLHFFCDFTYKKTNCLWGAIVLHIIYNIAGAVIILG